VPVVATAGVEIDYIAGDEQLDRRRGSARQSRRFSAEIDGRAGVGSLASADEQPATSCVLDLRRRRGG
jgi:hypothetical protein